jgi:hypothetical protein
MAAGRVLRPVRLHQIARESRCAATGKNYNQRPVRAWCLWLARNISFINDFVSGTIAPFG